MMISKFVEHSYRADEWSDVSLVWFWHDANPYVAKFALEKLTGILMARDASDAQHLSYSGTSIAGGHTRSLLVRFEAVIQGRNLYSLSIRTSALRKLETEEAFLKTARRTFEFWCEKLSIPESDIFWQERLSSLYEQRRSEALDAETAAAVPANTGIPVPALQQEILAAMRAGMTFFTANKEGGTHLKFDGKSFVRSDYGESTKLEVFNSDDAMLACLRSFFDWDSRRAVYPHHLPECEVWQYIRSRLKKPHV